MHRLRATIPVVRMQRYDDACRLDPDVDGVDLYRWANSVALAVFEDLGHVEVAMRSAMARELADRYGLEWYDDRSLLDEDGTELVEEAKGRIRLNKLPDDPSLRHGKLVASLMFGFWVKLLGRGQFAERDGIRERRIYDTTIWKAAVRRAFPGVGDVERQRVENVARRVQVLRNRIAHHEHIIWGVPLVGERKHADEPVRLDLETAHASVIQIARFLDDGLASWLTENSRVGQLLDACPIYPGELLLRQE